MSPEFGELVFNETDHETLSELRGECDEADAQELATLRTAFDEARIALTWASRRICSHNDNWDLMANRWLEKFKGVRK